MRVSLGAGRLDIATYGLIVVERWSALDRRGGWRLDFFWRRWRQISRSGLIDGFVPGCLGYLLRRGQPRGIRAVRCVFDSRARFAILRLRRIQIVGLPLGRGVGSGTGIPGSRLLSFKKTEHTFYTTRISLICTYSIKASPERA
jgi:hypothetical protein